MSGFSMCDVRFRRTGGDACDIVVHRVVVGTVMGRPDLANPAGGRFYVVHLYDDRRGPRQVDDRDAVRGAIASMLVARDLVPPMPPPARPDHAARRRHRPA